MLGKRKLLVNALILAVLSSLLLIAALPAQAQTETVIYNFTGGSDGANPWSRLTSDGKGNFYGTTYAGGMYGYGTVFEISPNGYGGWNEIVLHSFNAFVDGGYPAASLVFDNLGNLYGTARFGVDGQGVAFELSPVGESWTETTIYNFVAGGIAFDPWGGLIIDSAGNLYGQAYSTQDGLSSVFELSPSGGGEWTLQVIYAAALFTVLTSYPTLTMDAAGNIFGTQLVEYSYPPQVFELSPNGNGGWNETVLYTFVGPYSVNAEGTLVLGAAGNIYGATRYGGPAFEGSIFKLSPGKNGKWKEKTLFSFNGKNGYGLAYITLDAAGNIYGTTEAGGKYSYGVVFKLVAPVGKGGYKGKTLWNFNGPDGSTPSSSPILDSTGSLYGTTLFGGGWSGYGTVFKVSP